MYNFLGLFEMNFDMLYLPNGVTANKIQYYFKPFDESVESAESVDYCDCHRHVFTYCNASIKRQIRKKTK